MRSLSFALLNDPIAGQLCEAYGKDCTSIEHRVFQGAVGSFTFETTTVNGLMTGSHVSSTLFRVR